MEKTAMKTAIPFFRFKNRPAGHTYTEGRLCYKAGQIIFYEGHYPYGIYILRKGRIRLFRRNERGVEELLKIVEPAQILGEKEFLEHQPFRFSAKAETDVSASFLSRIS